MLNFTPLVLLPSLLQTHVGYPESTIGLIIAFRGLGGTIGFLFAMFIGRLDPRIGMTMGFGLLALSGIWLMELDLNVGTTDLQLNSFLQGLATGIVWVPLSVMAFSTLDRRFMSEGMAVFHLLRNIGSSLFISLSFAMVVPVHGCQLQPDDRVCHALQPCHESALGNGRLDNGDGAWPGAPGTGDQPPGGDDRLSERVLALHGDLDSSDRSGLAGAAETRDRCHALVSCRHLPMPPFLHSGGRCMVATTMLPCC